MTSILTRFHEARLGAAAFLAVAVLSAGTADAQTITVCAKANGQLRLAADASECGPAERAVQWNVSGPRGEQGLPGEQGPVGEQGPQGAQGPPGPGFSGFQFYTVGSADFRSAMSGAAWQGLLNTPGTFGSGMVPLIAPVHLPEGAEVFDFSARVLDNVNLGANGQPLNLTVELLQQDLQTGSLSVLRTLSSSGQSASLTTLGVWPTPGNVPFTTIQNEWYAYFVRVAPTAPNWTNALQIVSAIVSYSMPVPAPLP